MCGFQATCVVLLGEGRNVTKMCATLNLDLDLDLFGGTRVQRFWGQNMHISKTSGNFNINNHGLIKQSVCVSVWWDLLVIHVKEGFMRVIAKCLAAGKLQIPTCSGGGDNFLMETSCYWVPADCRRRCHASTFNTEFNSLVMKPGLWFFKPPQGHCRAHKLGDRWVVQMFGTVGKQFQAELWSRGAMGGCVAVCYSGRKHWELVMGSILLYGDDNAKIIFTVWDFVINIQLTVKTDGPRRGT